MKTLIVSLLLVVSLMFSTDTSLACTCAPAKSAAQELERSTAVFSGKVVEIKRHKQAKDIFARVEVVFRVEKSWKGVERRTVSVFTSSQSSACGYGFKEDRTYLVYAHGDAEGRLSTSICSRTRRLKDAGEDLEELGAGSNIAEGMPKDARRGDWSPAPNNSLNPTPR
jgi:Tissue inhibitor of metalloproteinase